MSLIPPVHPVPPIYPVPPHPLTPTPLGRRKKDGGKQEGGRGAADQQDGEVGEVVAAADDGALHVRGLAAVPAPAARAARACRRAAVGGWHSTQGTGTWRGHQGLPGLPGRQTGDALGVAASWRCPCPGRGHTYWLQAARRRRWHLRHPGGKGTERESWGPSLLPGKPRIPLVPAQRGDTFSLPNSRGNAVTGDPPGSCPRRSPAHQHHVVPELDLHGAAEPGHAPALQEGSQHVVVQHGAVVGILEESECLGGGPRSLSIPARGG